MALTAAEMPSPGLEDLVQRVAPVLEDSLMPHLNVLDMFHLASCSSSLRQWLMGLDVSIWRAAAIGTGT